MDLMNSRAIPWMCTLIILLVFVPGSFGQAPTAADLNALRAQIDTLKADYEKRVAALEMQLQTLQAQVQAAPAEQQPAAQQPTAQVPTGAQGAGGPAGALPVYGRADSSKVFNPDIAVIGDFISATGSNKVDPAPVFDMHESEVSFQAIVDPYARADFFISFGQEGVDLEEGYITFPAVPGGILAKAGKMRAAFGKVNTMHNHVLPWIDRPLMTTDLVAGEDGINDAGFSVARLIPNRWFFLEATAQAYRGDSFPVFNSSKRGNLSYVGHLRGYQDISESTNIDLGVSYAHGHNPAGVEESEVGQFKTTLYGTDATLRWRPLKRSIYRSFVGRSEVVWSLRGQPGGKQRSLGYYISGDYQFGRRWFAGLRYDHSQRADNNSLLDTGQSAILTYWPSEFAQLRGQYRRTQFAIGPTANEFLMQLQFAIGAHGAHPF
jgi:hypothetical protein